MKRFLIMIGLCAMLGGWGCSMVTSVRPVGDMPLVLDPIEWEGTWIAADGGPVVVKVDDARKGQLKLAWIEGDKEMVLKTATVILLKSGAWHFANLRDDTQSGTSAAYLFACVKRQKNVVIVWLPRPERFAGLIEEKVLPGAVSKERISLGELQPEHMKIIASEGRGLLFDWENPVVLMKTGDR